jgi:tetratricopeptide (TPR) repeat protein
MEEPIMKKAIACLVAFIFMLSAAAVVAEIKSLIEEYTYQASELDSKASARAIALEQVKRQLLEEIGTYVESTTVVQDSQIDKDEIKTLSAGVVQTKVLDEKWDGKEYWLKAQVSADPDEVAASIDKLRNDQQLADELAQTQAEKEDALNEVERLKAELAQSNADKEKLAQYNDAVNQLQAADSFQQGTAYTVAGDYDQATKSYDRVIYLRPDDPRAYFGRSIVFIYLGNYDRATNDLDRAMVLRPDYTNIYFQRAAAYKNYRENRITPGQRFVPPFTARNLRPIAPPRIDPLQNFLAKKQAENKLVRVNPFQPRPPAVRKDPRFVQQKQIRDQQYRQQLEDKRNVKFPNRQKTLVSQPVKPEIRKQNNLQPARLDRNQPVVQQRGDTEQMRLQKRNLQEEQRKNLQLRNKELNDQRALQQQQRRDLRQKEGTYAREQGKLDARKQGNVPKPRVEKKQPVVQQPKRQVAAPKVQQQKVKTPKQIKEEEEKAHRK